MPEADDLRKLTEHFKAFGASNPEQMADSEISSATIAAGTRLRAPKIVTGARCGDSEPCWGGLRIKD